MAEESPFEIGVKPTEEIRSQKTTTLTAWGIDVIPMQDGWFMLTLGNLDHSEIIQKIITPDIALFLRRKLMGLEVGV